VAPWDIGIDDQTAIWFFHDNRVRVTAINDHGASRQDGEIARWASCSRYAVSSRK
jgi:hypothetical protein